MFSARRWSGGCERGRLWKKREDEKNKQETRTHTHTQTVRCTLSCLRAVLITGVSMVQWWIARAFSALRTGAVLTGAIPLSYRILAAGGVTDCHSQQRNKCEGKDRLWNFKKPFYPRICSCRQLLQLRLASPKVLGAEAWGVPKQWDEYL